MAREYKDSANREHSYAGINYAEEQPVLERKLKDSGIEWIGEIPVEWNVTEIKRIMRNKSVRNQPDAMVLSLYRDYGIIPKDSRDDNFNVTSDDTTNYKVVGIGDFVINKMKAWQGSMAVSEFDGIISPAYYVCSFTDKNISRKYIHYLLRNESYKPEYMRLSTGLRIGQWDLGIDDFMKIPIVLPSLDEQQRIADFLDEKCGEIDKLVSLQEQMIEELKAYKQSVITETVTKGLNPDAPMRDSGIDWIGDVPKGWYIVALRYLFTIKAGGDAKPELYSDTLDLLHPYPVYTNTLDATQVYAYTSLPVFKGNSITVTGRGAVGHAIYRKNDYDAIIRLLSLSPKCYAVDCRYYAYYIDNVLHIFTNNAAIAQLSTEQLAPYKVLLPSLVEQRTISSYLDAKCAEIDKLILIKQNKISELKKYKKSIIFEYVTGKKQVV
jgi:type I restriction enzyme S subunit